MKFFHKVANSNRRKNSIDPLLIDGILSSNRVEISEHIVQFYKELYTEQFSWRPLLDGLSFDSTGEAESIWMEREFEEREVLEVVKAINGDKALGPLWFLYGVLPSLLRCARRRHYGLL
jgi:hypothetical protein